MGFIVINLCFLSQRLREPIGSSRPGIAVGYGPDLRSRDRMERDCEPGCEYVCCNIIGFRALSRGFRSLVVYELLQRKIIVKLSRVIH